MGKRLVQLILLDGDAKGIIQARLDNWTGVVYKIPFSFLKNKENRKELSYPGIYIAFGKRNNVKTILSIGQVHEGRSLLYSVADSWSNSLNSTELSEVLLFTTKEDYFGSADLSYIEKRFKQLAFVNKEFPEQDLSPRISEAKEIELDHFVENSETMISVLGYEFFELSSENDVAQTSNISEHFNVPEDEQTQLISTKPKRNISPAKLPDGINKGIFLFFNRNIRETGETVHAKAIWGKEGITVLEGSDILFMQEERGGLLDYMRNLRNSLLAKGDLTYKEGNVYTLGSNQTFKSPSSAGQFVLGGAVNGRAMWKTETGVTFEELETSLKESKS